MWSSLHFWGGNQLRGGVHVHEQLLQQEQIMNNDSRQHHTSHSADRFLNYTKKNG